MIILFYIYYFYFMMNYDDDDGDNSNDANYNTVSWRGFWKKPKRVLFTICKSITWKLSGVT